MTAEALLSVRVAGAPKPQGSKRGFVVQGKDGGKPRAIVVDAASAGKGRNRGSHADWRSDVIGACAREWDGPPHDGPVAVWLAFALPKPQRPKWWVPAVKPDVDKLTRTVLDALTIAGVLKDDSLVCDLHVVKRYPGLDVSQMVPGVLIRVAPVTEGQS